MPDTPVGVHLYETADVLLHLAAKVSLHNVLLVYDFPNAVKVVFRQFTNLGLGLTCAASATFTAEVGPMP